MNRCEQRIRDATMRTSVKFESACAYKCDVCHCLSQAAPRQAGDAKINGTLTANREPRRTRYDELESQTACCFLNPQRKRAHGQRNAQHRRVTPHVDRKSTRLNSSHLGI